MCGIAGAFSINPDQHPSQHVVEAMISSIVHRGPDDLGFFTEPTCVLGHCRLSILDLTKQARQPMVSDCGQFVLIYNGEIYNFKALRQSLENLGETFSSQSDTEVVLKMFKLFGPTCVKSFEGMFAFAVYDRVLDRLHLIRDRMGEKPLFYANLNGIFYFASEIKAFWNIPSLRKELNPEALIRYFLHTQPPPPHSFFVGIKKMYPGHHLIVDHDGSQVLEPYWHVDFTTKHRSSTVELVEQLEVVLTDAVNSATVSDQPIGLMLSGGIDSSLVQALINRQSTDKLSCFTVTNADSESEDIDLKYASHLTQIADLDHHIFSFDITSFQDMQKVLHRLDEPLAIYDAVIAFFHCRQIVQHRRVMLSGSGADEVFGGYDSYLQLPYFTEEREVEGSTYELMNRECERFKIQAFEDSDSLWSSKLAKIAASIDWKSELRWLVKIAKVDNAFDAKLLTELFVGMSHCSSMFDIVGMASSIEFRSPFLNHKVVEFAANIPVREKVHPSSSYKTKRLLKKLATRHLPEKIIDRPKSGYSHQFDMLQAIVTSWQSEIEAAFNRNEVLLSDFIDVQKARHLVMFFDPKRSTTAQQRRVQKLIIFLAWFDQQNF